MKLNNTYFLMRHGEAIGNKINILSSWPEQFYNPLTPKGRKQVKAAAEEIKKEKISLIFASDILRTKQTAEIIGKELGIKPKYDKRLREWNLGIFEDGPSSQLRDFFKKEKDRFRKRVPKGENYKDIIKRMYGFFKEINKKYKKENILIISHEAPLTLLEEKIKGFSQKEIIKKNLDKKKIETGEWRKIKFTQLNSPVD